MQIETLNGTSYIDEMLKIEKKAFASHWNKQSFIDELSSENGLYLGAFDKSKIVGYTGLRHVLDEGHITTLAVDRRHRKKGVGTFLISKLLERAKEIGLSQVYLEVRQSNLIAQKIYKKHGFKILDRRREYYQHPVEDALVMQNIIGQS